MTEKEKIKLFLKNKGVNPSQFYSQTGLSNGFLDKGKSIGVDKLKIIISIYPDFDLNWFLSDNEEMAPKMAPKLAPKLAPNIRPNNEEGATSEKFPADAGNGCQNCKKLEGDIFFLRDIIKANNQSIACLAEENSRLKAENARLQGEKEELEYNQAQGHTTQTKAS